MAIARWNLLFAVLVAMTFVPAVLGQEPDGVMLFNGRDATGMSQAIPVGVFQVNGKQLGSEVSIKVATGYSIRFCSESDGTGKCDDYGEGVHNLVSLDFKFIRVSKGGVAAPTPITTVSEGSATTGPPPVTVFEQLNWLGRSQTFGVGMFRSFRGEFGKINDNQARSIAVAKGFRVRLCSDEGMNYRGAGDCEIHEEGRHNLRFSNSISFIEVTDTSESSVDEEKLPVVLYEDASQAGKMQGFREGSFSATGGDFKKLGDNNAGSIWVKAGYQATVCSDAPASPGGEPTGCEEFGPGKKNLKSKKTASFIRVAKAEK